MTNNVGVTDEYYRSIADEMLSKLRRVNNFTSHRSSIGSYHEEALKTALRSFLPERYSIRTGFIYVEKDIVSNQIDLLLVDESDPLAYFFKEGEFAIVHPRAVSCAIEVKTVLNRASFKDAVENIFSFRELETKTKEKLTRLPPGIIFSFDSPDFTPNLLDGWYKSIDSIPEEFESYPSMILSLKRGRIDLRPQDSEVKWGHYFVTGEFNDEVKSKSLSILFRAIVKYCLVQSGEKQTNPFGAANLEGLSWAKEYLRFGKGIL